MDSTAQLDPLDNPYRAPAGWQPTARGGYDDPLLIELRAFVGSQADYYLRKWARVLDDPQLGEAGVNWVALFVPLSWLGYRRMYKLAAAVMAAELALYVAVQVLFVDFFGAQSAPLSVTLIITVMVRVVCALYGNAWYLDRAQLALTELRQQRLEGERALNFLARRGGTSGVGMVLTTVLSHLVAFVTGIFLFVFGYG